MRRSSVPGTSRTVWPGSVRGLGCSCASAFGDLVGDVLHQLPPSATFKSCCPPQMPKTGRSAATAPLVMASSNAVRRSLVVTLACRDGGAEERGIDIERAAGDDQPMDEREIGGGEVGLVRQQDRQARRRR